MKVLLVTLVACAVVAQCRVLTPKGQLAGIKEASNSNANVDSRIMSSGNSKASATNSALSNSQVMIKNIKSPKTLAISQGSKADTNQKAATQGGSVKASQSALSNASEQARVVEDKIWVETEKSSSKANEKVLARGPAQVSQNAGSSTKIDSAIKSAKDSGVTSQTTSTRLDEKLAAGKGGKAQASQAATADATKKLNANDSGVLNVQQNAKSQSNEQLAVSGPVKISQKENANTVDKVDIKTPKLKASITDNTVVNANQQVLQKSGSTSASQKSQSSELSNLDINQKKGVNVNITEKSASKVTEQAKSNGVASIAQNQAARASEDQAVKVAGKIIQVKDSSDAKASDKIALKGGKSSTSQTSSSKSNENLKAKIIN